MAKWSYLGIKYKSISINWEEYLKMTSHEKCTNEKYKGFIVHCNSCYGTENILVYHPKWDKCFTLLLLGWHGNGNDLKAQIEDIYTKRIHWVCAKTFELVIKRK